MGEMRKEGDITLYIQKMVNKDPIAAFLRRLSWHPFLIGVAYFVGRLFIDFLIAFIFGGLFPSERTHGILREPMAFAVVFISATLIGTYSWLQQIGTEVIEPLFSQGIVQFDVTVEQLFQTVITLLQAKWMYVMALGGAITGAVAFALSIPIDDPSYVGWVSAHPAIPWIGIPLNTLTAFVGIMTIWDIGVFIFLLANLFRGKEIKMSPAHPDHAGGLGSVGKFSANLGVLIGAFGVLLSVAMLSNTMPKGITSIPLFYLFRVGGIILYIIIAPIFFFAPLYFAHRAMIDYKKKNLLLISQEIDRLLKSISEDAHVSFLKVAEEIQKLQVMAEYIDRIPVWPFDQKSIRRFYGLIVGGILPAVINIVLDMVKFYFFTR